MGGGYCNVCYAMNYECMTLLIVKSWETKNRSTNTVKNEGWTRPVCTTEGRSSRFYNGKQSSVEFAKLRTSKHNSSIFPF